MIPCNVEPFEPSWKGLSSNRKLFLFLRLFLPLDNSRSYVNHPGTTPDWRHEPEWEWCDIRIKLGSITRPHQLRPKLACAEKIHALP